MEIKPVILAAGNGTRMNSDLPKVLHPILERPMISHLLDTIESVGLERPIIIVGKGAKAVRKTLGDKYEYVLQRKRLGSGHAVKVAKSNLQLFENVLVVCGDMPLLHRSTLEKVIDVHEKNDSTITFTSLIFENPEYYKLGRVSRKKDGTITKIIEDKDATDEDRKIKEGNTGVYLFNGLWLCTNLDKLEKGPKGEYCLTNLIEVAANQGKQIISLTMEDPIEAHGVNTKEQLEEAEQYLAKYLTNK